MDAIESAAPSLRRTLLGFIGDVLVLAGLSIAFGVALISVLAVLEIEIENALMPVMLVSYVGVMLAAWPLWRRTRRRPALQPATSLAGGIKLGVIAGLATLLLIRGKEAIEPYLFESVDASNLDIILPTLVAQPWMALVLFGLIGPWVEELAMRRVLLGRFLGTPWPWLGVVLTSVLFAWLHEPWPRADLGLGQWLWLLAGYTAVGLVCAGVYWRTRRLSAAFATHATNNLITCGLLLVGV